MSDNKLEGLILAAGYSSRFKFIDSRFKKYFLKLNNSNILGYIVAGMTKTGIKKITVVTSGIFNKLKRLFNRSSNLHPFGLIPTEYNTFNTKATEVNKY